MHSPTSCNLAYSKETTRIVTGCYDSFKMVAGYLLKQTLVYALGEKKKESQVNVGKPERQP